MITPRTHPTTAGTNHSRVHLEKGTHTQSKHKGHHGTYFHRWFVRTLSCHQLASTTMEPPATMQKKQALTEKTAKKTNFSVQALLKDVAAPEKAPKPFSMLDKEQTPAQKAATLLVFTYQKVRPLLVELNYKVSGHYYYLTPDIAAKKFALEASRALSPEFTHLDESVRSEALQHFERISSAMYTSSTLGETAGTESPLDHEMFAYFAQSVHQCASLEEVFASWEQGTCQDEATLLHELLIEGEKCADVHCRFTLEDEPGYLERSYRGLLYLMDRLATSPDRAIGVSDLNQVAAIIGTSLCSQTVTYGVKINARKKNPAFSALMQKSVIINDCELPAHMFKNYAKKMMQGKFYIKNTRIFTDYADKQAASSAPYFQLKLYRAMDDILYFKVKYLSSDKQGDCQQLLDDYYAQVATKKQPLDIIEAVVSLCCELQRRHLFSDGNGRISVFMLMHCLLAQQGLWLKKTVQAPWDLFDHVLPAVIAKEVLPLCTQRPVNRSPIDWRYGLTEVERIRLLCVMGETKAFIDVIRQQPELLEHTFRPRNLTLLEMAARHHQKDIVQYILTEHLERVSAKTLNDLATYLKSCSSNEVIKGIVQAYNRRIA